MRVACIAAVLVMGLALPAAPRAAAQDIEASKKEIEQLVEHFRVAIINKDTAGFMKLFLREDITWAPVYTDGSVQRYNAGLKDPKVPRATKVQGGTPRSFIESIARKKDARAETFSNVRIDTDGDIAHVWFDYTFMIDNYKNNWGKESWQLVRTEHGWKIASVVWSAEENPVPR